MHTGPICSATTPSILADLLLPCPIACIDACHSDDSMRDKDQFALARKLALQRKKASSGLFTWREKELRRIDLKANSHVFSAFGESFSHAPLEGVQGANVSQRLQTANTAEEQGKKPIFLERGRNQQHALPWCFMSVCCSFCGDGFSRPSLLVQWEHQTLGYSDMGPAGICCLPQSCFTALESTASSMIVPATGLGRCFPFTWHWSRTINSLCKTFGSLSEEGWESKSGSLHLLCQLL